MVSESYLSTWKNSTPSICAAWLQKICKSHLNKFAQLWQTKNVTRNMTKVKKQKCFNFLLLTPIFWKDCSEINQLHYQAPSHHPWAQAPWNPSYMTKYKRRYYWSGMRNFLPQYFQNGDLWNSLETFSSYTNPGFLSLFFLFNHLPCLCVGVFTFYPLMDISDNLGSIKSLSYCINSGCIVVSY